jgi:hypothetical protein
MGSGGRHRSSSRSSFATWSVLGGGQHYTSSIRASDAEGRTIADFVLRNVATRVHHERDWEDFNAAGQDHNHGDGDCHGDGESATE